jgi:hypothetical protein
MKGPHLDAAETPCGEGERCAAGDGDEPFSGPNARTTAAFDNWRLLTNNGILWRD